MSDGHPRPGPPAGGAPGPGPGADPTYLYGQYGQYGQPDAYAQPDAYGQYGPYGQYAGNQQPQQYHQAHLPHQHQHPEPVREFHHAPQQGWNGWPPEQYAPVVPQQAYEFRHTADADPARALGEPEAAGPPAPFVPQQAQAHSPRQSEPAHGFRHPGHPGSPEHLHPAEAESAVRPAPARNHDREADAPAGPTDPSTAAPDAADGRKAARLARRAGTPDASTAAPGATDGRTGGATPQGRKAARLARKGGVPDRAPGASTATRGAADGRTGEATPLGRKAARLAREAGGPDGPTGASTAARDSATRPASGATPQGRKAARMARKGGAAPDGAVPAAGARPRRGGGQGPQRNHRWAGLVKGVALCAAVAAAGMLVLRAGAAVEGLGGSPAHPGGGGPGSAAVAVGAGAVPDPGRVVQIVAHPDDDLYFMNPDLRYSISAGHPVTSVYLTAGEADGVNATPAKGATTAPNKPAYAEARQNGIRAAYAKMATGDRSSAWKRTVVPTKGGGHAEVDVLVANPKVNLVWLQLREAGHGYADVPDSLHGLWDGKVARLESMLSSGTPVKQRFAYSKDQVVQTLVGVLEQYTPTTVRFQDPTPGRYPDTKQYTDHQDHFYGARFVQMATAAYAKDVKDRPHFAVQNYVGYFNGSLPSALDPQEAKEKLDSLDTYAWLDRQNHCGSDAGCGDLKVSDHPAGNRWTDSINYARGTGTNWLTSDKDHGLWAFKVLDGQIAVWHRPGPVGAWRGPDLLPGTGMDPGASAVTLKDGRIAVFSTRTSFGARPADYKREVVYAVQKGPGTDGFGEWQSLGTPETADETWTSDISAPAVSVDGTGQLAAYVRDGAYGLRGRVQQADGGWGPWEKHGGEDLHGAPVTATDGAGRRMVLSATSKSVVGWAQPKPGAPLGRVTATGLPDTTLPLTAEGREGGVRLWFRKPGSGNVRTALMTADGGLKVNHMTDLGGLNGFGSVTASGHVLAGRAAGGQLGSEVGPGRPWGRSPLMFVGAPSSTMTGKNMVSLAVVGLDARLYVTSSADAPDAYLAPWQPVGPRNAAP
ncbi:PIG-L family deacetylase [Streptomyces virginiae]|uniref:PIG-L family deacetylase n=1 Tax=Streptomyces virginiae TaxID=1961 RepID=UPI00344B2655